MERGRGCWGRRSVRVSWRREGGGRAQSVRLPRLEMVSGRVSHRPAAHPHAKAWQALRQPSCWVYDTGPRARKGGSRCRLPAADLLAGAPGADSRQDDGRAAALPPPETTTHLRPSSFPASTSSSQPHSMPSRRASHAGSWYSANRRFPPLPGLALGRQASATLPGPAADPAPHAFPRSPRLHQRPSSPTSSTYGSRRSLPTRRASQASRPSSARPSFLCRRPTHARTSRSTLTCSLPFLGTDGRQARRLRVQRRDGRLGVLAGRPRSHVRLRPSFVLPLPACSVR